MKSSTISSDKVLTQMRMVPVRASLIRDVEVVEERISTGNRTLGHKRSSVCPSGSFLEYAVPVLGYNKESKLYEIDGTDKEQNSQLT